MLAALVTKLTIVSTIGAELKKVSKRLVLNCPPV